ncbi:MAG TPA: phosphopantetheine-binding protein [Usitatibacter sp.]|nr:phosphopantetheine-binding protein [Usitatibacter sp.]
MSSLERLRALLQRELDLPADSLQPQASLESLGIDSLRMIEIVFTIEDEFKVAVRAEPAELRERLKTLGDLAAYVDELSSPAPAAP